MKQYSASIPNVLAEVSMVGRITADVEMRFTPQATKVANAKVAVSRRYQQDGEWKETTAFYSAAIWGDAAERAANTKKGDIVCLTFHMGDMKAETWTGADGKPASGMKIGRAQLSRVAWESVPETGEPAEPESAPAEEPILFN